MMNPDELPLSDTAKELIELVCKLMQSVPESKRSNAIADKLLKRIEVMSIAEMQPAAKPAEFMVGQRVTVAEPGKPSEIAIVAHLDDVLVWVHRNGHERRHSYHRSEVQFLPNGQL